MIRAFRMEMEDAAHVTDVYSKVAAVTASDTEELINAMSKTASSAESVGSSFENTTAMIAVMINEPVLRAGVSARRIPNMRETPISNRYQTTLVTVLRRWVMPKVW